MPAGGGNFWNIEVVLALLYRFQKKTRGSDQKHSQLKTSEKNRGVTRNTVNSKLQKKLVK